MTHTHRCMRCNEEMYCLSPDRCKAGENVLPRIMVIGPNGQPQLFEHVCGKLAMPASVPSERGENAQRLLRRFRLIETGDGAEMKADPQGAYILYSDFASEREPINNDLTRLIDKMHDAVLDTDASGRPAGNLMDVWMELKARIEP